MSTGGEHEGDRQQEGTGNLVNRPVIMPEAYNRDQTTLWDQWIAHFDSVAKINGWDDATKLLWLQVRLTERLRQHGNASARMPSLHTTLLYVIGLNLAVSKTSTRLSSKLGNIRRKNHGGTWQIASTAWQIEHFLTWITKPRNTSLSRFVSLIDKPAVILQDVHGGTTGRHLGEDRTFKKLQERFYWPGYFQSSKEWCQNCPHCAARKGPTQKLRGPLQNVRCGYPMQMVAADFVGPFLEIAMGIGTF